MTCRPCAAFARACDRFDYEAYKIRSAWGWIETRETVEARLTAARDTWKAHLDDCPNSPRGEPS